jgi:hypothetical protein
MGESVLSIRLLLVWRKAKGNQARIPEPLDRRAVVTPIGLGDAGPASGKSSRLLVTASGPGSR